jgi:mono/diheme cytochrome c family protein
MQTRISLALHRFWLWVLLLLPLASYGQTGVNDPGFYVFFKKPRDWNQVRLYTWYVQDNRVIETSGRWPGKPLADVGGWYRGFIDFNQTHPEYRTIRLIFNNAGGQQTPSLERAGNGWYVWKDSAGVLINRWFDVNPEERLFQLTVKGGQGSGTYLPGVLVQIQAEQAATARFMRWEGPGARLLNDAGRRFAQLQMPDFDVTIEAKFEDLSVGAERYNRQCVRCHGAAGEGGIGPSLRIEDGRCSSCTTEAGLSDRIAKTMPIGAVGTCTGDCALAVARYIRFGLNEVSGVDCQEAGQKIGQRQIRLLTQREYRNTIRDLLGLVDIEALRFWPEPALVQGYDNNAESAVVSDRHALVFSKAAMEISSRVSAEKVWGPSCADDQRCLVQSMGAAFFRRPLDTTEENRLLEVLRTQPRKSQALLEVLLQSPQFLYRSELGQFLSPIKAFQLNGYEIASAMSYALTGSTPDATLLSKAQDGSLKQAEVRRSEALRLLETRSAQEHFALFAQQWLGIGGLPFATRDQLDFRAEIRSDMLEETRRFFRFWVFEMNGGVADLYKADQTFVSKRLASYYGLQQPESDWDAVALRNDSKGLLALGSITASYGNSQEASPIKRGVFVRNRLLCQELPPPPANVDTTIPPPSPGLTIRERLKKHISQGQQSDGSNACFSCHQYIDEVGFGFEAFDETAKRRLFYPEKPGSPIDVSGQIKSLESLADPASVRFQNLSELGRILGESQRSKDCFATQYFRFALGRLETPQDQCSLVELQKTARAGSIRDYMAAVIASDSFIYRR